MQFVKGGPDIDERLLQAHEDGKVVFFCGAGISYPAGLPGFKNLTNRLYNELAPPESAAEKAALKKGAFDTAIGLLESRLTGGRSELRHKLTSILTPDLTRPDATKTHESLLQLGTTRDGRCRLVTTNFDRLFEDERLRREIVCYEAPLLPIPKNRWKGLVYLHGLLPKTPTDGDLDRLVLSSGDFGLAYLTERWAARFVTELFRTYTVCFIGYSLNDPVLRYMMDALAADKLLGEQPIEAFAFGNYAKGKHEEAKSDWLAKNVTPILYPNHRGHAHLHGTLRAWAEAYRDGVGGKIAIVTQYGLTKPTSSTVQDDYVGRMLWAIGDATGAPAKHFSKLDPVPSLDWLEPLSEHRFHHQDLPRFGVSPKPKHDDTLSFSMILRPTPYNRAPWMSLFSESGSTNNTWDDVMTALASWLVRHMSNPRLLHWTVKRGQPTGIFETLLKQKIRTNPPPRPLSTLWQLVLGRRVQVARFSFGLYEWQDDFNKSGLTEALRWRLMKLLEPQVALEERASINELIANSSGNDSVELECKIADIVHWDLVLASDSVHYFLENLKYSQAWQGVLPSLLPDFTDLLHDALRLMKMLEGADLHYDYSFIHRPLIENHPSNSTFRDWTALIDLVRDAWLHCVKLYPEKASAEALRWAFIPFPLFRRLLFFVGAASPDMFSQSWLLDRLLDDKGWWIWSQFARPEAMQLLCVLVRNLTIEECERLHNIIVSGPPPGVYRDDLTPDQLCHAIEQETYRLLSKVQNCGGSLTGEAKSRWIELKNAHPDWPNHEDEKQGLATWSENYMGQQSLELSPQNRHDLEVWLTKPVLESILSQDDWSDRCRNDFPRALTALLALAQKNQWNVPRWRDALNIWWQDRYRRRSWEFLAEPLSKAPNDVFEALKQQISMWTGANSKVFKGHDGAFFCIAERIVSTSQQGSIQKTDDFITSAFNHPIGHMTYALLNWWYRQAPSDGQGLPPPIKRLLDKMTDPEIEIYRYSRAILSMHVIGLFRVDPEWTKEKLLVFFNWNTLPAEAKITWSGFLFSPRLYEPLLTTLKNDFLKTAKHYADIQGYDRQYAKLLTYAALELPKTFTPTELATAMRALAGEGLNQVSQTLVEALRAAGDQSDDYWTHRILPFLKRVWPRTVEFKTPKIAKNFAMLCIASGTKFPVALLELKSWLMPIDEPATPIHFLYESGICSKFPTEALQLLNQIVPEEPTGMALNLPECLEQIKLEIPKLGNSPIFQRLSYTG